MSALTEEERLNLGRLVVNLLEDWGIPSRLTSLSGFSGCHPGYVTDLDGKALVSPEAMVERVTAAVAARRDPGFVIIARTDAFAAEGLDRTVARARAVAQRAAQRARRPPGW